MNKQPNPKITLRCMVDNTAMHGTDLWGEHGIAFWIETPDGNLLFDTGQSGDVLVHNAELMRIDFKQCDALALSHAHNDHTGGLEQFFKRARPGIPLYANPDIFRERYIIENMQPTKIGMRLPQIEISRKVHLHLNAAPAEIFPGIWTTGEISDRREPEGRSSHGYINIDDTWQPDPYKDDLSLVLQTPQGLVLVCGCCHAGLLNTLAHVRRSFSQPVRAIIGGTHLVSAGADGLNHIMAELPKQNGEGMPSLYLNHCTGDRAMAVLTQAFDQYVHPCPAGTALVFE